MTAVAAHPSWRLPHRVYPTQPVDPDAQIAWAIEQLVEFYTESDDATLLVSLHALLQKARGPIEWPVFWEAIERLCVLSMAVDGLRFSSARRWPEFEAAQDEYAAALTALATLPERAT